MSGKETDRKPDALVPRISEVNKHFAAGVLENSPADEMLDDTLFLDSAVGAFLEALAPYGLSALQRDGMLKAFRELKPIEADLEFDSNDERIDELFAEITQLSKAGENLLSHPRVEKALAELREMQKNQAAVVYAAHVDMHLKPIENAWKKIREADDILQRHEDSSTSD